MSGLFFMNGMKRLGIGICIAHSFLSAASVAQTTDTAAALEQLQAQVNALSAAAATKRDLGLPIHGFGAVGYAQSSDDPTGQHGGFLLGNFDFYMTPSIGPRVKTITELNFEYGQDGTLTTDLERLEFGYLFNDWLTVWMGRFHTPYGYWNTAFHHGTQLQPSALRPRFLDFEDAGGILPAHSVGLNATGHWRLGDARIEYDAYVANGDRIEVDTLQFNAHKDDNGNKEIGANVRYVFGGELEGLMLGLHGYTDAVNTIDSFGAVTARTRVTMYGAFGVFERDDWQVLSEYYRFANDDLNSNAGSHSSWAGYVQTGYAIAYRYVPYLRYEKANLDQTDAYFANQKSGRSYTRRAVGLRYNLHEAVSLKCEWQDTDEQRLTGSVHSSEMRLEFAVAF